MSNDRALSWAENICEHEEPPDDRFLKNESEENNNDTL